MTTAAAKAAETRARLVQAEARGMALFEAIENSGMITPGKRESELDREIFELAKARFGVERHWHKRVVRTGLNTLTVYYDMPDDRVIEPDDTIYLDLGPVFGEWEADIGKTYALGDDPDKKRLVADLSRVFEIVKAHFDATPDITGAELFAFAQKSARDAGWDFGNTSAGHIVGEFPHAKRIPGDKEFHRIAPANTWRMRDPDANGDERHWILEIHLVDKARGFGGFYERLL